MRVNTHNSSFTQAEYEQAAIVNILQYLQDQGYEFEREGHEYRLKLDPSLTINENGKWYWNYREIGGKSPIFLLKEIESISTVEAVKRLCGNSPDISPASSLDAARKNKAPDPPGLFELPPRHKNSRRVFAYLNLTRCIDKEIISQCMQQHKIYESEEHHNAVFVAYDKGGIPRYATMRGTSTYSKKPFRGDADGSDKSYPFALEGDNNRLYVFESTIDALSHATLFKLRGQDWQADHRIALCGMNNKALPRYLQDNPEITEIVFCLDNDYNAKYKDGSPAPNWGQLRAAKLHDEYCALGYSCSVEMPQCKDVNEDLVSLVKELVEEELDEEEDCDEEIG